MVKICEPNVRRRQNTEKLHKKLHMSSPSAITDEIADEADEHVICLNVTAQLPP